MGGTRRTAEIQEKAEPEPGPALSEPVLPG